MLIVNGLNDCLHVRVERLFRCQMLDLLTAPHR